MTTSSLLLERLGALIHQSVRDDAARHGLLPIHVQVLRYLAQANRYSDMPIVIAEYFGITRGTVSQSLVVLERKGFLVKQPDARHGKRVHLRLTASGESVVADSWAERVETALQALSPDATSLDAILRGVLAAMQRINGQRAFGICRECVHFLVAEDGSRCGLTGESLAAGQELKICREWTASHALHGIRRSSRSVADDRP
jgi:MarR family transcriptional regulator, negative regulator of the multidrug operon emrRAB